MFVCLQSIDKLFFLTVSALVPSLLAVALFTIAERKILAGLQRRHGPTVVGIWGFLQVLADGFKLILKDTKTVCNRRNKVLFILCPLFSFVLSFGTWALVPFSSAHIISCLNYGLLWMLALSSLKIYTIFFSGWSSNSKYPLLGGLRAVAQVISYEISLGFCFLCVSTLSGTLDLMGIVLAQRDCFFFFPLLPVAFLFFLVVIAETNRPPFDMAEAESELVAGYNLEYSAIYFAFLFLGEYCSILVMSALWVVLFFGGWLPVLNCLSFVPEVIWMVLKTLLVCFFIIVIRGIMPRYRYDQLMQLGWKVFFIFAFSFLIFLISFCYCVNLHGKRKYYHNSSSSIFTNFYTKILKKNIFRQYNNIMPERDNFFNAEFKNPIITEDPALASYIEFIQDLYDECKEDKPFSDLEKIPDERKHKTLLKSIKKYSKTPKFGLNGRLADIGPDSLFSYFQEMPSSIYDDDTTTDDKQYYPSAEEILKVIQSSRIETPFMFRDSGLVDHLSAFWNERVHRVGMGKFPGEKADWLYKHRNKSPFSRWLYVESTKIMSGDRPARQEIEHITLNKLHPDTVPRFTQPFSISRHWSYIPYKSMRQPKNGPIIMDGWVSILLQRIQSNSYDIARLQHKLSETQPGSDEYKLVKHALGALNTRIADQMSLPIEVDELPFYEGENINTRLDSFYCRIHEQPRLVRKGEWYKRIDFLDGMYLLEPKWLRDWLRDRPPLSENVYNLTLLKIKYDSWKRRRHYRNFLKLNLLKRLLIMMRWRIINTIQYRIEFFYKEYHKQLSAARFTTGDFNHFKFFFLKIILIVYDNYLPFGRQVFKPNSNLPFNRFDRAFYRCDDVDDPSKTCCCKEFFHSNVPWWYNIERLDYRDVDYNRDQVDL